MAENQNNGPEYGRPLNGAGVLRISRSAKMRFSNNKSYKIVTSNVRSMFESGKINNTIREMQKHEIGILGVSEMQWPDHGSCTIDNYNVYYSGDDGRRNKHGVAVIISKEPKNMITNVVYHSARLIMVQMKGWPVNLNIIQVYAPTCDAPDDEMEIFYEGIQSLIRSTKSRDFLVVMGDFNAKIGQGTDDAIVGKFVLGERNERGDRLAEFCRSNKLIISNTFIKLPKRKLYTWKSPADTANKVIRNQIDFITISERYKNSIKFAKTFPGADVPSNHNLLAVTINIKFKTTSSAQPRSKLNVQKLKSPDLRIRFENENEIETKLLSFQPDDMSIEEISMKIKNTIMEVANNEVSVVRSRKKEVWMTDEILALIDERSRYKNKNNRKYKDIHRSIRVLIRKAKEEFHKKEYVDIEGYKEDTIYLTYTRKLET
ncbi:craniofacial development protein 2-like [Teleopsis dalmanni]|uniref:craniofacial development protein 2-like n=1 Tax=Teleopsis dalmanni TaxID=139649 RepID=UPI0018CD2DAF|nr:craniofacial development protein 2-like [Teleopsis dalmanni]